MKRCDGPPGLRVGRYLIQWIPSIYFPGFKVAVVRDNTILWIVPRLKKY